MPAKRKILEKRLERNLASYATKSSDSPGRKFKEKEDEYRMNFQKDKERVIHSKAFRRLDAKTQVFIADIDDHFRTRLTHTLEVAQVSRDVARRLMLNEDLCEVIALAHDLGHPPFGHAGESVLDEIMHGFGGHFEHNEQTRRIVTTLEKSYPQFDGLNLTYEVLDGLIKHQSPWDQANTKFAVSAHLEAQVVNLADEIAYTNHDIDDGLRSGLLKISGLEKFTLWRMAKKITTIKYGKKLSKEIFVSRMISAIMAIMISDLCLQTEKNIKKYKIKTVADVRKNKKMIVSFSPKIMAAITPLRKFLYKNLYMNARILNLVEKGKKMMRELFEYYLQNPDKFPKEILAGENFAISVKDYIAGMTDNFLLKQYENIYNDDSLRKSIKLFYGVP